MTDFCFSAFMDYDILKKLGGDTMATILMIDDERPILELVKNGLTFSYSLYVRRTGSS